MISWRRERLPTPVFWPGEFHGQRNLAGYSPWGCKESNMTEQLSLCFPCGSAGKESACNAGNLGSIPGLGRSPGEGKGYPLQYSGLENSIDSVVHGITKSQTQMSDFHFLPFFFTFILLSVKSSGFIYVVAYVKISFLF